MLNNNVIYVYSPGCASCDGHTKRLIQSVQNLLKRLRAEHVTTPSLIVVQPGNTNFKPLIDAISLTSFGVLKTNKPRIYFDGQTPDLTELEAKIRERRILR